MRHATIRIAVLAATALAAVLPLGAASPVLPPLPEPQDLGGLGGSPLAVHAVAVTRNGIVVGGAQDPAGFNRPFYWTAAGGFQTIGATNGVATAANTFGKVVGTFNPLDAEASAFFFSPPNTIVAITAAQAFSLTPQAVNDAGLVAGVADMNVGEQHVFSWTLAGGFRDLGWLGGGNLTVTDITENGLIVGYGDDANGETRAFQSRNGQQIRNLGTLGGNLSQATAANDNGVVVGYSRDADGNLHAFRYSMNHMTALVTEAPESYANAINASGMIVGASLRFGIPTATVWSPAGAATEIAGADIAVAVNDSGIVALYGGMTPRAYLWSAATGLQDGGSDDDAHSQAIGVTADGRLVALRHDWSDTDKVYVWNPSAGRTLIDGLPGVWSRALYVNAAGKVAGISRTTLGYNRAFVWTPSATGGSMIEVPAPAGHHSQPVGLNATGAVAGTTSTNAGGFLTPGPSFYWSGGGTAFSDLGAVQVVDVNNAGQVLGYVFPTSAFVWKAGVFTTIPSIGAGQLVPSDLSNAGQVVGRFNVDAFTIHAFSWKQGAAASVDLGTLGGTYSEAVAVNDSGQIAGNSTLLDENITHAFRTTAGKKLTDLGSLFPGGQSIASAMNKNGVVVGQASVDGSVFHAFLYDNQMRNLGEVFDPSAMPVAINDLKDVIGTRNSPPLFMPHAWVAPGGGAIVDLPNLAGNYSRAFGVNATGVVVGDALDGDNQQHAVLWRTR